MDPCKNPDKKGSNSTDESYLEEMMDQLDGLVEGERADRPPRDGFELDSLLDNPAGGTLDTRQYNERDYESHRRESFPVPVSHQALRHLHSASPSTSQSKDKRRSSKSEGQPKPQQTRHVPQIPAFINYELESLVSPIGSDIVSVTQFQDQDFSEFAQSPQKKVQFEIGGGNDSATALNSEDHVLPEKKKHRKHHHHHHHHHIKQEDLLWRLRGQGSEQGSPQLVPSSLDLGPEVATMDDLDQENLSSHRFSDNKAYRRHKMLSKIPPEETLTSCAHKPVKYDHQPHEIFVELDVLSGHGEHREWKEAARWIKYEEDVEEGADRWGRPHVASLSFHSLINLRRLIETGVTLLDLEERDLPGVAYRAVEAMVVSELILPEDRALVMRSLLLKHKHVNESDGWKFNLRRNTTSGSLTSLHAMIEHDRNRHNQSLNLNSNQHHNQRLGSPSTVPEGLNGTALNEKAKMTRRNSAASRMIHDPNSNDHHHHHHHHLHSGILIEDSDSPFSPGFSVTGHNSAELAKLSLSNLSEEEVKWVLNKESLLRRIPVGAEASIVLVGKDEKLKRPIMSFIRLAESSYMPNITELPIPVRFIYILLGPSSFDLDYKEIGRSISTLMSNRHFHEIAYKANDRRDMLKGIHEFLDESIVLPPGDWDNDRFPFEEMKEKSQMLRKRKEKRRQSTISGRRLLGSRLDSLDEGDGKGPPGDDPFRRREKFDPLQRTKKFFGGLTNDVKRRYKHYLTDIRDGLNFQVLASIIFIYFACVSGAIAFGGILGEKTEKHIGISETLIATAAAGFIFAIFSGQPLIIVGTTGPLLLFDESLYKICVSNEIDFLAFRFWIGIWVMVIGLVVVALDGSFIARYFTRFVQEIFASLISLLFIFDAVNNIVKVYMMHPLRMVYGNCSNGTVKVEDNNPYPNTALLSSVLCIGTFAIAYSLRSCRTSGYFTPMIRNLLGNFAVPIAIVAMVGVDIGLTKLTHTEKLKVPNGLQNSKPGRDNWLVFQPMGTEMIVLAIIPAALVFILMFMETCICSLIVGKKEMKLQKGGGYHLDIFLICCINGGIATIGGCWVCAATLRAVAHASSLTVYSTNNPPGEKPTIVGVKEQRLSSLVISLLVGISVLMSPALVLIPMSVLFGVFLYMGISSMSGIQFFERCTLLFKQVVNHPQVPYVRRVRTSKMHLFTIIQVMCLFTLFAVKLTPGALAIPFLLILLVPLRHFVLKSLFKPAELKALDGKGGDPEEEDIGSKPSLEKLPIVVVKEPTPEDNLNKHNKHNGNGVLDPEHAALMNHFDSVDPTDQDLENEGTSTTATTASAHQ